MYFVSPISNNGFVSCYKKKQKSYNVSSKDTKKWRVNAPLVKTSVKSSCSGGMPSELEGGVSLFQELQKSLNHSAAAAFCSVAMILIGAVVFSLQAADYVVESHLHFVAAGFWAGAWMIVNGLMGCLTFSRDKKCLDLMFIVVSLLASLLVAGPLFGISIAGAIADSTGRVVATTEGTNLAYLQDNVDALQTEYINCTVENVVDYADDRLGHIGGPTTYQLVCQNPAGANINVALAVFAFLFFVTALSAVAATVARLRQKQQKVSDGEASMLSKKHIQRQRQCFQLFEVSSNGNLHLKADDLPLRADDLHLKTGGLHLKDHLHLSPSSSLPALGALKKPAPTVIYTNGSIPSSNNSNNNNLNYFHKNSASEPNTSIGRHSLLLTAGDNCRQLDQPLPRKSQSRTHVVRLTRKATRLKKHYKHSQARRQLKKSAPIQRPVPRCSDILLNETQTLPILLSDTLRPGIRSSQLIARTDMHAQQYAVRLPSAHHPIIQSTFLSFHIHGDNY